MKVRNCHIFSKQRGFKWPWKWYYGNPINHLFAKISEESCSITSEQFISKYVLPRKPVILKVLELCWSLWRDDVHFTLKNRACNLQIISQLIKFQGCLDVALFRRPANFGSFTFDSMIHRFFGGSTNMTESVSTLLFNNLEPAKSLVDTYLLMINLQILQIITDIDKLLANIEKQKLVPTHWNCFYSPAGVSSAPQKTNLIPVIWTELHDGPQSFERGGSPSSVIDKLCVDQAKSIGVEGKPAVHTKLHARGCSEWREIEVRSGGKSSIVEVHCTSKQCRWSPQGELASCERLCESPASLQAPSVSRIRSDQMAISPLDTKSLQWRSLFKVANSDEGS